MENSRDVRRLQRRTSKSGISKSDPLMSRLACAYACRHSFGRSQDCPTPEFWCALAAHVPAQVLPPASINVRCVSHCLQTTADTAKRMSTGQRIFLLKQIFLRTHLSSSVRAGLS